MAARRAMSVLANPFPVSYTSSHLRAKIRKSRLYHGGCSVKEGSVEKRESPVQGLDHFHRCGKRWAVPIALLEPEELPARAVA